MVEQLAGDANLVGTRAAARCAGRSRSCRRCRPRRKTQYQDKIRKLNEELQDDADAS